MTAQISIFLDGMKPFNILKYLNILRSETLESLGVCVGVWLRWL